MPSFHAVRWRLEPLLSPTVVAFTVVLAVILYMAIRGLSASPSGQSSPDPRTWVVAALLVLFLIGLAWSLYMSAWMFRSGPRSRK